MRNLRNSKLLVFIAVIAVFALMTCVFTACNEDGTQQTTAFNVVFDLNDGSGETVNQEVDPHKITYTPPTREGYDFLHWTMDKDGNTPLSVNDIKNGTILYAQWKIKTYTVKFFDEDLNLISSVTVNHGESATPPTQEQINEHLKAGRVFVGWNQSLDNITRNLAVEMITDSNVSKYTVVFMDGDKEIAKFENGSAGSLIPKPDNPQKKDGFHFDGWKTKDGKTYSEESIFSADETYYSVWTLQDPSTPQIEGDDSIVYGNSANMSIQQNSIQEFDGINYVYEWLDKDGKVVASGNSYQTGALATGEYSYKIRVTASCEGYESKSAVSSAKSLTVEKATLTATLTGATLVYGDDIPTTLPVTFTGFVNGDDESVVNSDNVSYETTYYAGKDTGKYTVTAKGFQAQNYDFTVQSALLTVEQKQISVEKTFEKVYDGKFATAELKEAEGLLDGHVITITFTTKNANVGNYSTNNANEITIDKKVLNAENVDVTGNYAISASASASILPADIKYELPKVTTFDFDNKSHSAQLSVATPNCRVEYSKDNVNFSQNAPQYARAGSYKVYVKMSCANYNPVETSFDLTINKAHIAFKATTQNTTYGQNFVLDDKAYVIEDGETFGVNFEVKLSTEYTVGNNAGNYTINITATETDANNFEITTKAGYIEVAPATVNIALKDATVTYGSDLTLSDDLATVEGVYNNDDVVLALSTTYDKATASVNKTEKINATIGNTNYTLGEVTGGVVTVKPFDVALTVNNATVVYGENFALATLTTNKDSITLANNDTFGIEFSYVDNAYAQGANANTTFKVTAKATILNGEDDRTANYNITVTDGTLTVLQREVSIKVNDVTVTYGEAIAQEQYGYTVTSGSFFKEENIKPTYSPTYAEGNFGDGYTISATINDANHKINITAGAVNITKRKATTTYSKDFVQTKLGVQPTVDLSTLTFTNRYTGDSFSGVLKTVSADNGIYTYGENGLEWTTALKVANIKGEDVTAMYDVSLNVTVSIFESAIAHTSTPQSATYNGKEQTLNGLKVTETGLKNLKVKYSTNLEDGYTLENVPTFKNAGDYTVYYLITADDKTPTEGTYTVAIAKKAVTISADDKSVVYGDPAPEFTYTPNGIVEGDTINVNLECAYTQGNNAGEYDIIVKYEENANYAVTGEDATLTVTQKVVNIALKDATVTYGSDLTLSDDLATVEGVYNNDDVVLALSTTYDKATASVNKAEKINATIGNTNYTLGEVTGGVVTVKQFDVALTVNNATVVYGENFDFATLTTDKDSLTLANGDVFGDISFSYVDSKYEQGANAGSTFKVTATATIFNGEDDRTANYNIAVTNGTLTVEKREVNATTSSFSVVYGDDVDTTKIGYTVTEGSFYGTPTITNYALEGYAPGMFGEFCIDIELDETTCSNHKITLASGKLTVTPREITVHHKANVAKTDNPYSFTIARERIDNAFDGDEITIALTTASADVGIYTANGDLGSQFILDNATFKKADDTDISTAYTVKYDLAIDISKNIITATVKGVTATFDGTPKSGSIEITDETVTAYTIKYAHEKPLSHDGYTLDSAPSFTDAGIYTVYFLITAENKTPTEGSYTVAIAKAKISFTAHAQTAVYSDEFTLKQDAYTTTDETYGTEFDVKLETPYVVGNDVGTYAITLTATEKASSNFDITPVESTLTVKAKEVTVTAKDVKATYGTLASMPEFTVDVEEAKEFISLSANDYTAKSNVGEYAIIATSSNKNYTVKLASAYKVVVEQLAITVSADDKSMVYGDATPTLTHTPTGLVEGDTLSGISLAITKDGNVVTGTLNAGEYVITLTADADANANYAITTKNGTLTVAKREVSVKANDLTVTYGEAIANSQYGYAVTSGSFFGDVTATYETTYEVGKFGNGYTVNVKFDEATVANHNVTCDSGNVVISKRDVTVEGNKEFVQNNGVFHKVDLSALTLNGVYGEDKLAGVLTLKSDQAEEFTATTLDKFNVTQSITIKNANGDDVTEMYNIAYDIHVNVFVKEVIVDDKEKTKTTTYNGTDQNQNLALPETLKDKEVEVKYSVEEVQNEATVAEDIQYTLDTVLLTKAGTYKVYFRIEVKDGSYTTTFGWYIVKINKIKATITAEDQTTVYGEQINSKLFTTTGILDNDLAGFNISVTTDATNPSVGEYTNVLKIAYTENANYEVVTTNGKLNVTQRELTVTAENVTVTYGDNAPALTPVRVEGLVDGDTTTTVTLSSDYVAGSPVGSYKISPTCSSDNYSFSIGEYFVNVEKRDIKFVVNASVTYGEELVLNDSLTNKDSIELVSGDTFGAINLTYKDTVYTVGTPAHEVLTINADVHIVRGDEDRTANYNIEVISAPFSVYPARLTATVTLDKTSVVYGEALPTASVKYTGFVLGETEINLSGKPNFVFDSQEPNVGTHTVTIEADSVTADNYTIEIIPATFEVTKAELIVTPKDVNVTFGEELPKFDCTIVGFKYEDANNLELIEAIKGDITYHTTYNGIAGTYTIAIDQVPTLENYDISTGTGKLQVNKANYGTIPEVPTFTTEYSKGAQLGSLNLSQHNGFSWDASKDVTDSTEIAPNGVGTYTFKAIYCADPTNYNPKSVDITVHVEQAEAIITHKDLTDGALSAKWTGKELSLETIIDAKSTNTDEDFVFMFTVNAPIFDAPKPLTGVTDGGVYEITISGNETKNFSAPKAVTVTVKITSAIVGSNENDWFTVEDAIAKGGQVTLKGNAFISDAVTIASGTTLILPSTEDSSTTIGTPTYQPKDAGKGSTAYIDATTVSENDKTLKYVEHILTIPKNTNVKVGGAIIISGVLGFSGQAGNQGHTSGMHSQIINNGTIDVNGSLDVRGYIKGNGLLNLNSNSMTYSPFVVLDFRGGTNTTVVYRKGKIAPFNRYEMPNIQCDSITYSGATHKVYLDLYASSNHNTSVSDMYGSNGVLKISSGGYIKKSYADSKTTLTMVGNITMGSLSLTVMGVEAKMSDVLFPIPLQYNIIIGDGVTNTTLTAAYQYKLMTGASITIVQKATLNLSGKAIVYSAFTDTTFGGMTYPNAPAAVFTVNGTLNVTGTFAGNIVSNTNGAKVIFASNAGTSLSSKEGNSGDTSSLSALFGGGTFTTVATISETAKATNEDGTSIGLTAGKTYTYNNGSWS